MSNINKLSLVLESIASGNGNPETLAIAEEAICLLPASASPVVSAWLSGEPLSPAQWDALECVATSVVEHVYS